MGKHRRETMAFPPYLLGFLTFIGLAKFTSIFKVNVETIPIIRRTLQQPKAQKRRIVLLAGPHKTSSSSIQVNMFNWLHSDNNHNQDITGLAQTWAYPTVEKAYIEHNCTINEHLNSKIFYPLIESIKGRDHKTKKQIQKDNRCFSELTPGQVIDIYKHEIHSKWKEGYNILLASEALDFIASERRNDGPEILEKLLHILPRNAQNSPRPQVQFSQLGNLRGGVEFEQDSGSLFYEQLKELDHNVGAPSSNNNDLEGITAVVAYRAPRVDHLISLWHQCCMTDMTFYEYLTERILTKSDALRSLDSLKLTQIFLDRKIPTILIDMSGVTNEGYDMSNIIACDVLNADCTDEKLFSDNEKDNAPQIANVKQHLDENFNVTEGKLAAIDKVIEEFDCNFQDIVKNDGLTILYPHKLMEILGRCNEGYEVKSREEMVERIRNIALGVIDSDEEAANDDDYYNDDDDYNGNSSTSASATEEDDRYYSPEEEDIE